VFQSFMGTAIARNTVVALCGCLMVYVHQRDRFPAPAFRTGRRAAMLCAVFHTGEEPIFGITLVALRWLRTCRCLTKRARAVKSSDI
jgi:hypothetical protein